MLRCSVFEAKIKDAEQEKVLQLAAFTLFHFTNEEIQNNLTQVEEKIMKWIEETEKQKR